MADKVAETFRRDIDRIPVLPRERWFPPSTRSAPNTRSTIGVVVAVVAAVVAVVLFRPFFDASEVASAPQSGRFVFAGELLLTRQAVLAPLVRTRDLGRITRFEAKFSTQSHSLEGVPSTGPWWVVAITGESPCFACPAPVTYQSVVSWVDARTGRVASTVRSTEYWPGSFDALPDESRGADAQEILGRIRSLETDGTFVLLVDRGTPSYPIATEVPIRTDGNTSYSWASGLAGGTAVTFADMVRDGRLRVGEVEQTSVLISSPTADGRPTALAVRVGFGTK